ncbi:MAG: hypothetical protein RLZZ117_2268 [Cyanobacteriota bacterium]|jgi:hypothetical protein
MNDAGPRTDRQAWRWAWRVLFVLALAGEPLAASAQVYCSRWAEVVDAPSHVRKAPSGQAAIACRLTRNGERLLVVPWPVPQTNPRPQWLATLACRPRGQRAAIGLGRAPDFIHRSQVRLLEGQPDDWLGAGEGQAKGPCAVLWQPYERAGDQPAEP